MRDKVYFFGGGRGGSGERGVKPIAERAEEPRAAEVRRVAGGLRAASMDREMAESQGPVPIPMALVIAATSRSMPREARATRRSVCFFDPCACRVVSFCDVLAVDAHLRSRIQTAQRLIPPMHDDTDC